MMWEFSSCVDEDLVLFVIAVAQVALAVTQILIVRRVFR